MDTNMDSNALKVWKFDDCDFVAALTLADAKAWYDKQFGAPAEEDPREIEDYDLSMPMRLGEGDQAEIITLAEQIERMATNGKSFPAVIAVDAHYA